MNSTLSHYMLNCLAQLVERNYDYLRRACNLTRLWTASMHLSLCRRQSRTRTIPLHVGAKIRHGEYGLSCLRARLSGLSRPVTQQQICTMMQVSSGETQARLQAPASLWDKLLEVTFRGLHCPLQLQQRHPLARQVRHVHLHESAAQITTSTDFVNGQIQSEPYESLLLI